MSIFCYYQVWFEVGQEDEMFLEEYLVLCKSDLGVYVLVFECMLMVIGEFELVDIFKDFCLLWIFFNKMICCYLVFDEFYGLEDVIENIVSYFCYVVQGLEEKKQILYLFGLVGGGKFLLVEKFKVLMQKVLFYVIKDLLVNELLLCLFDVEEDGLILEEEYGILCCYVCIIMLFWVVKCLKDYGGDLSWFCVVWCYFLILDQVVVVKIEFGDENNQDILFLVGKVDICKLEEFVQEDLDVYSFFGGLCWVNQGLFEFVEMFKVFIKVLYLLFIVIQEGNYNGIEYMGVILFDGIVLVYFNEVEWQIFCYNKNNEVFIDCVFIVKVFYCLRVIEE